MNGIDQWAEERQRMVNQRENKPMPDRSFDYQTIPQGKDIMVNIDLASGESSITGLTPQEEKPKDPTVYDEEIQTTYVGDGRVELIAGGGKIFTDIAARFVRSERDISEIISSDYSPEIVRNIINSGHLAATEFDMFIFAVSGYSRVCETQLVRKRLASYLIKSGRQELHGKRQYKVVYPKAIEDATVTVKLTSGKHGPRGEPWDDELELNPKVINQLIKAWYDGALATGKYKEQDLRYMKPQATMWQGIIGMNAHSLIDISRIRMCKNAQTEIRDLVTKMVNLAKEAAPDLMETAGPSCKALGYCPEGRLQNKACQGIIPTKADALRYIEKGWDEEHSGCFKQDPKTGEWVKAEPLKYTPGLIEKIAMLFRMKK